MYCSKCNKEIANNSKFCKYCGNSIEDSIDINNEQNIISDNNKYVLKKSYGIIIFLCIVLSALVIPIFMFDLFGGLAVAFASLIAIGSVIISTNSLIFKCPNCKEEVELSQSKLEDINDTMKTCKCPKCNKDLIFNTKDSIVNVNTITEKNEEHTTIPTSKLEELYNLKTKGIISEEEFENKKKEYLDKM